MVCLSTIELIIITKMLGTVSLKYNLTVSGFA